MIAPESSEAPAAGLIRRLDGRPLVLVGMMGAGKTTIGRRLAHRLSRRFLDSDTEVEAAANMKIEEIFAVRGEAEFRSGEARVIARLLREPDIVLATGGGAFINPETRALIGEMGVSIWIKADLELLMARVARRSNRPLLKTADPRATLAALLQAREPIYAEADITIVSRDVAQDVVADEIFAALDRFMAGVGGADAV